jgi:hypothetical protein
MFFKCPICKVLLDMGDGKDRVVCKGFCGKTFHINCLNLNMDKKVLETAACGSFLLFCDQCSKLQGSVVMRRFLSEAEDELADLVENLRSLTQKVDEMVSNAVASVRANVAEDNKTPAPVAALSPAVKTRAQRAKAAKEKAEKQEIPATRLTDEERRFLVLSRIHPDTTSDKIGNFIRRKTGITNIRCHLMIPRGKTVNELEYVSFKVGVGVANYSMLMVPELWRANVLVRDFEKRNRRLKPAFPRF